MALVLRLGAPAHRQGGGEPPPRHHSLRCAPRGQGELHRAVLHPQGLRHRQPRRLPLSNSLPADRWKLLVVRGVISSTGLPPLTEALTCPTSPSAEKLHRPALPPAPTQEGGGGAQVHEAVAIGASAP